MFDSAPTDALLATRSDLALLRVANQGDAAGVAELDTRHGEAIESFAQRAKLPELRDRLTEACEVALRPGRPLRAAWLGLAPAHDVAPRVDEGLVSATFSTLPLPWQTALWHTEVEGDPLAVTGRLLALAPDDVAHAVRSATAAIVVDVAGVTPGGDGVECDRLLYLLQLHDGGDGSHLVEAAAEHGRRCDACMARVRVVLGCLTDLRRMLLWPVLGDLSGLYLAGKPAPTRVGAPSVLLDHAARGARPTLISLAAGGVAALAVTAMVVGPSVLAPYVPGTGSTSYAAGTVLIPETSPLSVTPTDSSALPAGPRFSADDLSPGRLLLTDGRGADTSGLPAPTATDGTEAPGAGGPGVGSSGGDPSSPVPEPGDGPDTPGATPPPGVDQPPAGGGQPPASGDPGGDEGSEGSGGIQVGPVTVAPDPETIVTVDGPVVVTVPAPPAPPVVQVPAPSVPPVPAPTPPAVPGGLSTPLPGVPGPFGQG